MEQKTGLIYLAFFAFAMILLRNLLTYLQYRSYKRTVESLRGHGWILGVGMRRGGAHLKGGAIVILAWDRAKDRIVTCRKLEGIAMWKRFETVDDYNGMTLEAVRRRGIEEDYAINRRAREKEPYSPSMKDKRRKKGALIQAVEALDRYLLQHQAAETSGVSTEQERQAMQERIAKRRQEIQQAQKEEAGKE